MSRRSRRASRHRPVAPCRRAARPESPDRVPVPPRPSPPLAGRVPRQYPNLAKSHVTTKELRVRTHITGGAGFIGSHLSERFLAEGHEVIAVDNMITGDLANLDAFRGNPRFRFIGLDISNPLKLK